MTFAHKRLIAYVYDLCARGDFMRTMYVLCAWATFCVRMEGLLRVSDLGSQRDLRVRSRTAAREQLIAYVIVRLLRIKTSSSSSDRTFRAIWDHAMTWRFTWRTSGFVTRAICDHASDLIFSEILAGDRPSDLIGLYGVWVRIERSDWLVRILTLYRTIWLACTESSLYGTIWLACTKSSPYGTIWLDCAASRS